MHHEYAIEPELVAAWSDPKDFRYFWDAFGPDAGRFVGRFPDDWKDRLRPHVIALDGPDRARAVEMVKRLEFLLVDRTGHGWDTNQSWVMNAIAEDKRRRFTAILAGANQSESDRVLIGEELHPEDDRWKVERGTVIPREAKAIAAFASGLLRVSNELHFVDPFFEPQKPDRVGVLCALLKIVEPRAAELEACQCHLRSDDRHTSEFREDCERSLVPALPPSLQVDLLRWDRLPKGDRAHARYILTERGGIAVDYGLSEERGVTTDIRILEEKIWAKRLHEVREGKTLRFADGITVMKA